MPSTASKCIRFDLPQQYLSTNNIVEEFIEIVRRIQRQSTERRRAS